MMQFIPIDRCRFLLYIIKWHFILGDTASTTTAQTHTVNLWGLIKPFQINYRDKERRRQRTERELRRRQIVKSDMPRWNLYFISMTEEGGEEEEEE